VDQHVRFCQARSGDFDVLDPNSIAEEGWRKRHVLVRNGDQVGRLIGPAGAYANYAHAINPTRVVERAEGSDRCQPNARVPVVELALEQTDVLRYDLV
jgi:hypothetical protein